MIWCFKAAQTERYQCLAYPRSIGTEMESIKDNDHDVAQSMVERTITEALKVNPAPSMYGTSSSHGMPMSCTALVW